MPIILAVPRMHKTFSFCGENNSIHTFNPFSIKNSIINSYNMNISQNLQKISSEAPQKSTPHFLLLSENEARHYLTDLKRISREQVGVFSKENISYAQLESLGIIRGSSCSTSNALLNDEAKALESFFQENSLKNTKENSHLKNENDRQTSALGKTSSIQQNPENQMKNPSSLLELQKYLLLAYLQEEQDGELYALENSITKQATKIEAFLQNPIEKAYFSETLANDSLTSDTAGTFDPINLPHKNMVNELLEKEEEILESFSFNIVKDTSKKVFSIKEIEALNTLHSQNFYEDDVSYGTRWQEVFSAQLPFLAKNTLLFVNDKNMIKDLLSIAQDLCNQHVSQENKENIKNNKERKEKKEKEYRNFFEQDNEEESFFRFDEDFLNAQYEEDFLKEAQNLIQVHVKEKAKKDDNQAQSDSMFVFSYFACPRQKVFDQQNLSRVSGHQNLAQTLHFILLQK